MANCKIYEDDNHHLGLISEDGKHKTPAVYDEIQIQEGSYWLCRVYHNWDYFYPSSGDFSVARRMGGIESPDGRKVDTDNPTSIEDREVYDSLQDQVGSDYIYTYRQGKFGLTKLDGKEIIEPIYDNLDVWHNANVIQVRLGKEHLYFNDQRERILTDEPSCREDGEPYWDGKGWEQVMVRELVDSKTDNHTYESSVGLIRIYHEEVKSVAKTLEMNCERIPINPEAISLFTDRYSYEFGVYIIHVSADEHGIISENEWREGVKKLDALNAFDSSWHYIDKFMTNTQTMLSVKGLYWLKHYYEMIDDVLGHPCITYGIDNTLKDGEVSWMHVEHYNEHCFPDDYGVSDALQYGTLEELKTICEAHDWEAQGDPYGGCFLGYNNIRYNEEREWEETEKILNYLLELGHNPQTLTSCVAARLKSDTEKELDFLERCAEWALSHGSFPNKINCGETCYDKFLKTDLESKSPDIKRRIDALGEKFLRHGALTSQQLSEKNLAKIESLENEYDYSIIKHWT